MLSPGREGKERMNHRALLEYIEESYLSGMAKIKPSLSITLNSARQILQQSQKNKTFTSCLSASQNKAHE